jgi:hypothetical protein
VTAPVGAIVSLHVDLVASVGSGDIIMTGTGRRYRILVVREQARGRHIGRQHLRAIVVDDDTEPDEQVYAGPDGELRGGVVHRIRWYKRERRSRR